MKKAKIKFKQSRLIQFIREYRIHVPHGKQFRGIKDTLIGWAIIALTFIIRIDIKDPLLLQFSFVIIYMSGAFALFINVLLDSLLSGKSFQGIKNLNISKNTDTDEFDAHLSVRQRFKLIYIRGLIATSGWLAVNIASIYFGYIDNSAIFGSDALIFTILCVVFFGQKISLKEWTGIIISFLGIALILIFDIESIKWVQGIICASAAFYSAVAFAIIFFMTSIIVRHDTPTRVAFHQSLIGFSISLIVFLITLSIFGASKNDFWTEAFSNRIIFNSVILGVLYVTALYRFLRAFLFTEPIIIAVLGYSLPIFVIIFELLFHGTMVSIQDIISSGLITFGCIFLVHEEYKKEKKISKEDKSKPIYDIIPHVPSSHFEEEASLSLKKQFSELWNLFELGKLDRYEYISKRHEFNKLLIQYSSEIVNSSIRKIEIRPNSVIFSFEPLGVLLETDGAARSAPFEILNFHEYEPEDENLCYQLIGENSTIFDVGANIGWYSLNFSKRFPDANIYTFEPVPQTFQYLQRNLEHNKIENCTSFNIGISDKNEMVNIYYFKGGSAIASIENLIDHKGAQTIECQFKRLDTVADELKIDSLDFIKCDVEGSELFFLQGAVKTILKFTPIIFIEICEEWCEKCGYKSKDIISFLLERGYTMFEANGKKLREVICIREVDGGKYNYFFLQKTKHKNLIEKLLD